MTRSDEDTLTVSEAARLLGMSRPNVPAFLERRGIEPVVLAPNRRWRRDAIEAAKADYEASGRVASDALRRASAKGERKPVVRKAPPVGVDPDVAKTGPTQRIVLLGLGGYGIPWEAIRPDLVRPARQRLIDRGLVARLSDEGSRRYELTERGRSVAAAIAAEEGR